MPLRYTAALLVATLALVAVATTPADARSAAAAVPSHPRRATDILPTGGLSDEKRAELAALRAKYIDKQNKQRAPMRNTPHAPSTVNSFAKMVHDPVERINVQKAYFPDDGYDPVTVAHFGVDSDRRIHANTTARVPFTLLGRWGKEEREHGIRFRVNWEYAEEQTGIPQKMIKDAFHDAADMWHRVSPVVPRMRFLDASGLFEPSSFVQPRGTRNKLNEISIVEHACVNVTDHTLLSATRLWKTTGAIGTIEEADIVVMLHTHEGEPLNWHVGGAHPHPPDNHHLRRSVLAALGHALGLGHSLDSDHGMTGVSRAGEPMQLADGDRQGILALYA